MAFNQLDVLIGKEDIEPYAQMSILSTQEKQLHPHILAAQNMDVKPFLGNAFWTDLMTNQHAPKYTTLLAGGEYTVESIKYTFQGLKAALACYTYSRYVLGKNIQDSAFGLVVKSSEYSEPASAKQLSDISTRKQMEGQQYLSEVDHYLRSNAATYPLYETVSCETVTQRAKGSIRITPASRD